MMKSVLSFLERFQNCKVYNRTTGETKQWFLVLYLIDMSRYVLLVLHLEHRQYVLTPAPLPLEDVICIFWGQPSVNLTH